MFLFVLRSWCVVGSSCCMWPWTCLLPACQELDTEGDKRGKFRSARGIFEDAVLIILLQSSDLFCTTRIRVSSYDKAYPFFSSKGSSL